MRSTCAAIVFLTALGIVVGRTQSTDEIFAQRLVGTWQGPEIEKTYRQDGTAIGSIWLRQDPERTRVTFKSDWRVENGYLTSTVRESSSPDVLPIGSSFRDQLISVTEDEFVYINDGGERETRKRKKAD